MDNELGLYFRDKIVPCAVLIFTNEFIDDEVESDEEDSDDDEDASDDEEDGTEEEDGEEDEQARQEQCKQQ